MYSWVLNNAEFRRWCNGDSQLLWVKGDPGKGKTMLQCGIINELEKVGGGLVAVLLLSGDRCAHQQRHGCTARSEDDEDYWTIPEDLTANQVARDRFSKVPGCKART